MKNIIISLGIIGIVSAVAIGATTAYFNDTETSTGNTFTAGTIDLKIDLQCPESGCDFKLRDLDGDVFFKECDIKPGDSEEVTISWHVYDNNAWARIRLADIHDYENGCTEPEEDVDTTCEDPGDVKGELDDYLIFTLWMDEGAKAGWQCPDGGNGPCDEDKLEGDNKLNGVETILATKTARELVDGVELPGILEGSTTYYLGMQWDLPFATTGNIVQTDSLTGKIIMEVVQSRNNPNPWQ
ncbi:M73 family metallopeptidase [Patescibacteria group bacterium]|nr:hypothetical protein [Candidatus Falkowbacteria bacterium]MBU3905391.1 M73 family metallopeptidase [Patescibacteria group bacterium]MBU4015730.1 M73 family metallopeptidase [Patescibacteria group bacterium]MBU4026182.1 M73 family metallopeptidase [Patescibacteria group bacterium]MBU4072503.1 M73 family metallopeptidase [Patescibacteria group bacterium]